MYVAIAIGLTSMACFSGFVWQRHRHGRRERFIRNFRLPTAMLDALRARHRHLTRDDCQLVAQALRRFFLAHLLSGGRFVSMPSQLADDLWHEFIADTGAYARFCETAFGHRLHHIPGGAPDADNQGGAGLLRTWYFACHEEQIDPEAPSALPLLFALDSDLGIVNGFAYVTASDGFERTDGNREHNGGSNTCHDATPDLARPSSRDDGAASDWSDLADLTGIAGD